MFVVLVVPLVPPMAPIAPPPGCRTKASPMQSVEIMSKRPTSQLAKEMTGSLIPLVSLATSLVTRSFSWAICPYDPWPKKAAAAQPWLRDTTKSSRASGFSLPPVQGYSIR